MPARLFQHPEPGRHWGLALLFQVLCGLSFGRTYAWKGHHLGHADPPPVRQRRPGLGAAGQPSLIQVLTG